jgi:hypothetical protein
VIDVELPSGPAGTALVRGLAACLSSVTEVPVGELPDAGPELPHALGAWKTWLAGRGSGLVPIAEPRRFQWAGWWIAVVDGGAAEESDALAVVAFGTPPGVVLSPQAPALMGRATADLPILEAYVVASLDPVLHTPAERPSLQGTVAGLALAPAAEAPMQLVTTARARTGRGLDGDRYAVGAGTFSPRRRSRPGYDLTLIAEEVLDDLAATGHAISFEGSRRNVLTRGVDVNALVGRTFVIGDVECAGRRLCEPCAHLERLSGPGVLRPLVNKGGLRVDVLGDGEIRLGDEIRTV